MTELRAAIIKQTRRDLLWALNRTSPLGLSLDSLREVLLNLDLEEAHLKRDLTYLIGKGYVSVTGERESWHRRMFAITPAGDEIANRLVSDPALEP